PLLAASAATTELSTPPDMATTTRQSRAGRGRSNRAAGSAERAGGAFTVGRPYTSPRTSAKPGTDVGERRFYQFLTVAGLSSWHVRGKTLQSGALRPVRIGRFGPVAAPGPLAGPRGQARRRARPARFARGP